MTQFAGERFAPVSPDLGFEALTLALKGLRWRTKSVNELTRGLTFSTPAAGFSWGAAWQASISPAPLGCFLRVTGVPRLRTNVTAGGAETKRLGQLLDLFGAYVDLLIGDDPTSAITASEAESDVVGQLAKLAEMHTCGSLTDAEFAAAKAQLLG